MKKVCLAWRVIKNRQYYATVQNASRIVPIYRMAKVRARPERKRRFNPVSAVVC